MLPVLNTFRHGHICCTSHPKPNGTLGVSSRVNRFNCFMCKQVDQLWKHESISCQCTATEGNYRYALSVVKRQTDPRVEELGIPCSRKLALYFFKNLLKHHISCWLQLWPQILNYGWKSPVILFFVLWTVVRHEIWMPIIFYSVLFI